MYDGAATEAWTLALRRHVAVGNDGNKQLTINHYQQEVAMKHTSFFAGLYVLLFSATLFAQVPSLESTKSLPAGVYNATSSVSDGYGQHMVTIDNGTVKHYLIGNNGEEIAGYTQNIVAGGEYPAITSYGGKLRVTMKIGNQIAIYQSLNGGASWSSFPPYTPNPPVPIFDLDAYSDNNGTHITWATASTGLGDAEVYFVRYNDNSSLFANFKNVTDLTPPQATQGGRPKVVASSSEAHAQFVAPNLQLHSRDLNLSTGVWESSYIVLSSTPLALSLSAATIGNTIFCLVAQEPTLLNANHQLQDFYLTSRSATGANWGPAQYVTTTTLGVGYGYMRKTVIASPSTASVQKVYVATTCNYNPEGGCVDGLGITLRTYSSSGTLEAAEQSIKDLNSTASMRTPFFSVPAWSGSTRSGRVSCGVSPLPLQAQLQSACFSQVTIG